MLAIREATEADAGALRQLRLRALREEPQAFGRAYDEALQQSAEEAREQLLRTIASPDDVTFVADDGTQLLGMVGFLRERGIKFRHKGNIWGMYVVSEARGKHIGRALLGAAIRHARSLPDMETVLLGVITVNEAARGLYHAVGFEPYAVEPRAMRVEGRYYDEEFMLLRLNWP